MTTRISSDFLIHRAAPPNGTSIAATPSAARRPTGHAYEEAVAEFRAASRLGSNDAKSKLGTFYGDVIDPPQPDKAVYWYWMGVNAGDASCAWNLAMHYGSRHNKRWYRYWLEVTIQMGDADAQAELKAGAWWNKFSERA